MIELIGLLLGILLVAVVATVALVRGRGGRGEVPPPPRPGVDYRPGTGDDAEVPRDTPTRTVDVVELPESPLPAGTESAGPAAVSYTHLTLPTNREV